MQTRHIAAPPIPQAFIWRRLHSLTGIWLTGYIIFHLLTNSQAALWLGDDGRGFIKAVNAIHEIPYLEVVEILILAIPIIIHMIWGIQYALQSRENSFGGGEKSVKLTYSRNKAYTWQRITAWLLIFAIIAHIIHMRILERPLAASVGREHSYMVRIDQDAGLQTLAPRLDIKLYSQAGIDQLETKENKSLSNDPVAIQQAKQEEKWLATIKAHRLKEGQVIAVSNNFGTAELLMLRETFKSPLMLVLYTLFVMAAVFHGFNGLWTFLITWGVTLTERSQRYMLKVSTFLMCLVGLLGLSAIWLTYWVNLKQ